MAALEAGEIAGAGLDVFEDEPRVHPGLLARDDVVLLPHVGSATVETRTAMADLAVANVLAVLGGDDPVTPVRRLSQSCAMRRPVRRNRSAAPAIDRCGSGSRSESG